MGVSAEITYYSHIMDNTSGRRPIASRETGWAKRTASFLAKNNVTPNFISIVSIVFASISLAAFYFDTTTIGYHLLWMIIAVFGIQGRLIMNLLDGMVAVEHHKKSIVGGLYNEVPDRIADALTILGVGLVVADHPYGMDLAYVAIIIATTTAYIRTLGASLGCPHFFLGPMAKQHRMAFITFACVVAVWYTPAFYYMLILMNIGLVITCDRRLHAISTYLKKGKTA
jgi:phosphatidylglycerophosphate synthase